MAYTIKRVLPNGHKVYYISGIVTHAQTGKYTKRLWTYNRHEASAFENPDVAGAMIEAFLRDYNHNLENFNIFQL